LRAQAGLGQVQAFRRAAEVQGFRDGGEGAKLAQFHQGTLID